MALDTLLALVSSADVATYLKISGSGENTILAFLINEVSQMCNAYAGRYLLSKQHIEYYDGDGEGVLLLRNYPIISVDSLYNADATRTFDSTSLISVSANVIVRAQEGSIELWNNESIFLSGRANVKVTYTAGWTLATVPYDLQLAVKKWVAQQYKQYQNQRHDVQAETIGDATKTYLTKEMPIDVERILKQYIAQPAPTFAYEA